MASALAVSSSSTKKNIIKTKSNKIGLVTRPPVDLPDPATARVAVVGLGYVGLPLICGFSKASQSIGFDINEMDSKGRTASDLVFGIFGEERENFIRRLRECYENSRAS